MRHHDRQGAGPAERRVQLTAGMGPRAGVERGQRLVEQQHVRVAGEGARQRDTLPLAARQGGGARIREPRDAEPLEQLHRTAAPGRSITRQAEGDVPPRAQVGEQGVVLEHEAARPLLGEQVDAAARVEPDLITDDDPAGIRAAQAGDDAKQGGLAGSGWPDDRGASGPGHTQVDVQLDLAKPIPHTGLQRAHVERPPRMLERPSIFTESRSAAETSTSTPESARAEVKSVLKRAKIASGTVCVIPGNEPANIRVAPNSPRARPQASAIPEVMPCPAHGTATRMKARASLAPSVRAASSRLLSTAANASWACRR